MVALVASVAPAPDYSAFTDEELRMAQQLAAKAAGQPQRQTLGNSSYVPKTRALVHVEGNGEDIDE